MVIPEDRRESAPSPGPGGTVPIVDTTPNRRPLGVSLLSWLLIIGGGLDVLTGVLLLFQRNNDTVLESIDVTSSSVTTYSLVSIVLGLAALLIGVALLSGANWARVLVALLAVARAIVLIWVVVAYHQLQWSQALWPTAIYLLIAGYLFFDRDARAYYARPSHAA